MVKPVIFQIVGYQNSGKTTIMSEVIQILASEGYKVVTIKHHGHGGKPDIPEHKDSGRHVKAGAFASLIEGEGRVIVQAEKQHWKLEEQIQLISQLNPDVILIEGHKNMDFPKAILISAEKDLELLKVLTNREVVFCMDAGIAAGLANMECPVFHKADQAAAWIADYVMAEIGSMSP
ncbi:molybdopterin-guanine dinucleotide biosynthesis protein B [Mesobacillus foraminis]|uniref:molybdopterin-guanine dinucleotide biosynthesis protein B n=1 Tax=Mesobacillus foraminis TaxID=279826 RepID=UPI00214CAF30|nr:molybdopterin-guanine dinucleotide biosynthesis protein B [Mesobacillus foraminis]